MLPEDATGGFLWMKHRLVHKPSYPRFHTVLVPDFSALLCTSGHFYPQPLVLQGLTLQKAADDAARMSTEANRLHLDTPTL